MPNCPYYFSAKKGTILELVLSTKKSCEIMKQEASCVEVDLKQIKYQKILYSRGKMVSKEFEPSSSFWLTSESLLAQ